MDKEGHKRRPIRRGQAVMLTIPDDMMEELNAEARWRTVPVATAARQMVRERLEQIKEGRR